MGLALGPGLSPPPRAFQSASSQRHTAAAYSPAQCPRLQPLVDAQVLLHDLARLGGAALGGAGCHVGHELPKGGGRGRCVRGATCGGQEGPPAVLVPRLAAYPAIPLASSARSPSAPLPAGIGDPLPHAHCSCPQPAPPRPIPYSPKPTPPHLVVLLLAPLVLGGLVRNLAAGGGEGQGRGAQRF